MNSANLWSTWLLRYSHDAFYSRLDGLNQPVGRAFPSGLKRFMPAKALLVRLKEVNSLLRLTVCEWLCWTASDPSAVQQDLWRLDAGSSKILFPQGNESDWTAYALRYATDPSSSRFRPDNLADTCNRRSSRPLTRGSCHSNPPTWEEFTWDSSSVSSTRVLRRCKH